MSRRMVCAVCCPLQKGFSLSLSLSLSLFCEVVVLVCEICYEVSVSFFLSFFSGKGLVKTQVPQQKFVSGFFFFYITRPFVSTVFLVLLFPFLYITTQITHNLLPLACVLPLVVRSMYTFCWSAASARLAGSQDAGRHFPSPGVKSMGKTSKPHTRPRLSKVTCRHSTHKPTVTVTSKVVTWPACVLILSSLRSQHNPFPLPPSKATRREGPIGERRRRRRDAHATRTFFKYVRRR